MLNKIIKELSLYLESKNQHLSSMKEDRNLSILEKERIINTFNEYCPEFLHTKGSMVFIKDVNQIDFDSRNLNNKQLLVLENVVVKFILTEEYQIQDEVKARDKFFDLYETYHDNKIKQFEKDSSNIANICSLLIIAKLNPSTVKEDKEILLEKSKELNISINEKLDNLNSEINNIKEFSLNFQKVIKDVYESLYKLEEYQNDLKNNLNKNRKPLSI